MDRTDRVIIWLFFAMSLYAWVAWSVWAWNPDLTELIRGSMLPMLVSVLAVCMWVAGMSTEVEK